MARDHQKAIRAFRDETLACSKGVEDLARAKTKAERAVRSQLKLVAAVAAWAAEFLDDIIGPVERAARRAKKGARRR